MRASSEETVALFGALVDEPLTRRSESQLAGLESQVVR